jgi:cytochrome o ubiquinol oxidase subunit 2
MPKGKFILGVLATLGLFVAIVLVLRSEHALLTHPKGMIAHRELKLIATNIGLMLVVVVPTLVLLFVIAWRYRAQNRKAKYDPQGGHRPWKEVVLWIIPSIVIAVMALITWKETHALDPYRPLQSEREPLAIQVVALDWKWLFIYPKQGIATVNFVQFPAHRPIHFTLSADGSPMNSFWIPQLSGQIYSMTGMVTPLHLIADEVGEFPGRASEINGRGFADMTFVAKATEETEFEAWVQQVKGSNAELSHAIYEQLAKPSANSPVVLYADVEEGLFDQIVMKYMVMEQ